MSGQSITWKDGNVTRAPNWAADPKMALTPERVAQEYKDVEFEFPPRMEFSGSRISVQIVYSAKAQERFRIPAGSLIFQISSADPMRKRLPKDFELILEGVLQAHFGSTDRFSVSYEPEVNSWSLLASKITKSPSFSTDHYVERFLHLLDSTLLALETS